jgi:DnaJ-class molecular chaperone
MASVEIKAPKLLLVRPEDAADATEIFRIQMQERGLDIEDELRRMTEERKMIEAGLITTAVDRAIETGVPIGRAEVEPCRECQGKGTIALLTSVVACKACEGSGEGEVKYTRYTRTFIIEDPEHEPRLRVQRANDRNMDKINAFVAALPEDERDKALIKFRRGDWSLTDIDWE